MRKVIALHGLGVALLGMLPIDGHAQDGEPAPGIMVVTAVAIGLTAAYDIATAAQSARQYNARHSLGVLPTIDPIQRRVGLAFRLPLNRTAGPVRTTYVDVGKRWLGRDIQSRPRSPSNATAWSLVSTVVPAGVGLTLAAAGGWNDNQGTLGLGLASVGLGVLIGPSTGHWYAGQTGRGWRTLVLRLVLAAIGVGLLAQYDFD